MSGRPSAAVKDGLTAARDVGLISAEGDQVLQDAYTLFRVVTQVCRLLSQKPLTLDELGEGGARLLLGETKLANLAELEVALVDKAAQAADVISDAIAQQVRGSDEHR